MAPVLDHSIRLRRLREWRDAEAKRLGASGEQMFMHLPDAWFANPHFMCANGHVSTMILKCEEDGDTCLACYTPVLLGPPDLSEEALTEMVNAPLEPADEATWQARYARLFLLSSGKWWDAEYQSLRDLWIAEYRVAFIRIAKERGCSDTAIFDVIDSIDLATAYDERDARGEFPAAVAMNDINDIENGPMPLSPMPSIPSNAMNDIENAT
jgi:hypothetical protein